MPKFHYYPHSVTFLRYCKLITFCGAIILVKCEGQMNHII